jgi:hypothetical protein
VARAGAVGVGADRGGGMKLIGSICIALMTVLFIAAGIALALAGG